MIRPLFDRVVVKLLEQDEVTESGILLANSSKGSSNIAKVVEVGPGGIIEGNEVKMYINKGDKVIVNKYSGTTINYEGNELIFFKQSDILAIIEE